MASPNMAQRHLGHEALEGRHPLLRSPSAASDATTRSVNQIAVPQANPPPAYIAQHAAAALIASEIDRPVAVSKPALVLVNEFLDQVLYNILLTSRSTSLASLKSAVPTVLKPRLGKAALRVAEEELKEYLNDDEEVELHTRATTADFKHDFDPDLSWRLARLRCMVYTRLGDLEEEDEEDLLEKEGLRSQLQATQQVSQTAVETGPASAIFLTSIIEHLGEQALYYAAQHAQKRHIQSGNQQLHEDELEGMDHTLGADDIVVSGKDMNHVGRDSPLSRLWRSYRRNTREFSSRSLSPDVRGLHGLPTTHSRGPSSVAPGAVIVEEERSPHQIPLPIRGNDIDEIEVPGLAPAYSDEEYESEDDLALYKQRRVSMIDMPGGFPEVQETVETQAPEIPARSPLRPTWLKRSISSPVTNSDKASVSRQNSTARIETVGTLNRNTDSDSTHQPRAIAEQQRASSSRERYASSSPETVFGGARASIASALGMGILGIGGTVNSMPRSVVPDEQNDFGMIPSLPTSVPKRTAAEEMIGAPPTIGPPKDAQTGASITNMSDFASMHVPIAASPDPSLHQRSPSTPTMAKNNSYFQTTKIQTAPVSTAYANYNDSYEINGIRKDSHEGLKPAPLQTTSNRLANSRPGTSASERATRTGLETGRVTALSGGSVVASTVNALSSEQVQAQAAKTDLQAPGRQFHPDETQTAPPPSALDMTRETNSGSNSSASKRFNGKSLQIAEESDEAKKKSLEILIRGNETLHYTLTPAAAMRDEQSMTQRTRTQTQDMAEFVRQTGPREQESNARPKAGGLSSNPPAQPPSPRRIVQRVVTPTSPRGVVVPASPIRNKNPLGEPRDPRTEVASNMRDLADYARSTGPQDSTQLPQVLPKRAGSASSRSGTTPRAQSPPRKVTPSDAKKQPNRLKHQARDARPIRNDETSELIDFIREGPPGPSVGRSHRIDRKVAPFRTTMDSEDFDSLAQGRQVGSSLKDSEDGHLATSVEPSVSSQTPLIKPSVANGRGVVTAPPLRHANTEPDGMPPRTRRRIKDPYAISDSEDEMEDDVDSRNPRGQEESLIDFLRNTAPHPSMLTQPVLGTRPGQRSEEQSKANYAREASPHLTQSGSKRDVYRPTQPTHAAHVDRNRVLPTASSANTGRSGGKPRFEAREAKAIRDNTSELAEYLRNSGPAPNAQYQPQPFLLSKTISLPTQPPKPLNAPVKEERSIFKRFSRSKR